MKNAVCLNCVHLDVYDLEEGEFTCKAFPFGIPDDIKNGKEHNEILEGQFSDCVFEEYPEGVKDTSGSGKTKRDKFDSLYGDTKPCSNCKNFKGGKCASFERIPFELLQTIGHKKVLIGQNEGNDVFEQK